MNIRKGERKQNVANIKRVEVFCEQDDLKLLL